jgi:hypothetical protein
MELAEYTPEGPDSCKAHAGIEYGNSMRDVAIAVKRSAHSQKE